MIIYKTLDELNIEQKTSVALGNFDGLHVGHRKIMEDAINSASKEGLKSLCFTFSNHPFNFILRRSDDDPDALRLICSEDEKIRLIEDMGFDILVNIPFDEYIMTMGAEDFFNSIVADKLNAGCVSVGFNYTYGARAGGNSKTLRSECEKAGIKVNIHDAVRVGGEIVSSTLIRQMIKIGNMELTASYLGRPYSFRGTVSHGRRLGSAMGIPTVNIPAPADIMLPPNGVYFSRIIVDGKEYKSVSNIGVRPTVAGTDADIRDIVLNSDKHPASAKNIETNIFGFEGDAYEKDVIVNFDHFSRAEMKFASKEELFAQISKDCENAERYHDNYLST